MSDKDDQKAADLAEKIDPDAATVKDSTPAGSVQQERTQDDHGTDDDDHESDDRDDEFAVIVSQVDGEFVPINEYPYRLGE